MRQPQKHSMEALYFAEHIRTSMEHTLQKRSERGAAILIAVLLFTLGSLVLTIGIGRGVYYDVVGTRGLLESRQSYFTAEAGIEDVVYRHMAVKNVSATEVLAVGASSTATTTVTTSGNIKTITGYSNWKNAVRKLTAELDIGNGASFNFGMQADAGGITMQNSSSVSGNVFTNGSVVGGGSSAIYGDAVSAGSGGLLDGVHATGSARAHSITNSTIDRDAFYQTISSTAVGGTSYPGSADIATASLPIDDDLIEMWKAQAEAGTVITGPCPYTISSDVTLGATKIMCDTTMTGSGTDVTFTGPVWIMGNLTLEKATFHISSSLGNKSVQLISDHPYSHATGSLISLTQSTTFVDDDGGNSYVLLLSRNSSAQDGGGVTAIDVAQSASGKLLVYTAGGKVNLANSVSLKEVTGYQIALGNNTNVTYETGLASLIFTGGPGGAYTITGWKEYK